MKGGKEQGWTRANLTDLVLLGFRRLRILTLKGPLEVIHPHPVQEFSSVLLLRAVCSAVLCLVVQSCPALCNPMASSPPGSSVHGILQARILEWVAMPLCRGSSQPRAGTQVSQTAGGFFTVRATREAQGHSKPCLIPLVIRTRSQAACSPSSVVLHEACILELPGRSEKSRCLGYLSNQLN